MRYITGLSLAIALGCSGALDPAPQEAPKPASEIAAAQPTQAQPTEKPAGDWIDEAIDLAIEWEVMPGTDGGEDPERRGQLRTFFEAHPEYKDRAKLDTLQADACGLGIERTHEWLTSPSYKPLVVDVSEENWRVVVAFARSWCTSDDWSWFTSEVGTRVGEQKITYAYGNAENNLAIIQRDGKEIARMPLEGQGYAMLAAGKGPAKTEHSTPDTVLSAVWSYFGVEDPE